MDLIILNKLSRAITWIFPSMRWLSLSECAEQFGDLMGSQLDMCIEAQNLLTFRSHFRKSRSVKFPSPHLRLVTRNVLVESLEPGESLSTLIAVMDDNPSSFPPELRRRVASFGATAFFHMAVGTIGMQVGADAVFQRLSGVCRIGQTGQICDRFREFEFALGACLVFLCRIGIVK